MPCLVVFKLPSHPNKAYDNYDVVSVKAANQHPGVAMVAQPWRFGFIYITDKRAGQVRMRLIRPLYADDLEEGADPGDYARLAPRRRKILPAFLPAESRFRRYRPYVSDLAVKITWAELNANIHDKRAERGLLPGGTHDVTPEDEVLPD